MNAEEQHQQEMALLKQAVSYALEKEEDAEMLLLLDKLKSGRWMLTPVPWEEEV